MGKAFSSKSDSLDVKTINEFRGVMHDDSSKILNLEENMSSLKKKDAPTRR